MRSFVVLSLIVIAAAKPKPEGYNYEPGTGKSFTSASPIDGSNYNNLLIGQQPIIHGNPGLNQATLLPPSAPLNSIPLGSTVPTITASPIIDGFNNLGGGSIISTVPTITNGELLSGPGLANNGILLSSDPGLNNGLSLVGRPTSASFTSLPNQASGFGPGLEGFPLTSTTIHKEFLSYSAPEDELQEAQNAQNLVHTLKKNLRVIFIKAPENNALNNAALEVAKHSTESKTAIYVLSKQPDVADLLNRVQEHREVINTKPEIRFVKYRTPEDAINAQQAIREQYDHLGGTTSSSDEGIAPVLNYASHNSYNTPPQVLRIADGFNPSLNAAIVERKEYLPPIAL